MEVNLRRNLLLTQNAILQLLWKAKSMGFDSLSSSYSATITEERLNQLKNIAKEIFTEITQMSAKRIRQN